MVFYIIIEIYSLNIKEKVYIRFNYVYPKYFDSQLQVIFENHIIIFKKQKSEEWWLVTQKGLIKANDLLFTWDEKGLYANIFNFEYGIIYVNNGNDIKDLKSVIHFLGKIIY